MFEKEHCGLILGMSLRCLWECPSRDVHCGWIQLSREVWIADAVWGMRWGCVSGGWRHGWDEVYCFNSAYLEHWTWGRAEALVLSTTQAVRVRKARQGRRREHKACFNSCFTNTQLASCPCVVSGDDAETLCLGWWGGGELTQPPLFSVSCPSLPQVCPFGCLLPITCWGCVSRPPEKPDPTSCSTAFIASRSQSGKANRRALASRMWSRQSKQPEARWSGEAADQLRREAWAGGGWSPGQFWESTHSRGRGVTR